MTEPSAAARAAKFEQDQLKEKQINALLIHRGELQNALAGNEADLKHVGYRFPESPTVKTFILDEAIAELRRVGKEVVSATDHVQRIRDNAALRSRVGLLELSNTALMAKVKKLSAEKRKRNNKK